MVTDETVHEIAYEAWWVRAITPFRVISHRTAVVKQVMGESRIEIEQRRYPYVRVKLSKGRTMDDARQIMARLDRIYS